MARDITSAAQTASESGSGYSLVLMADLDFPSGHVRLHTGAGAITFQSNIYQGIGRLGNITPVEDTAELKANRVDFVISGVPSEYISTALNEDYRHRDAKLYVGFIDGNGDLVGDPMLAFWGRMDTMPITLGDTATITLRAASRLEDWDRPRLDRYTNESQQEKFPGDLGLEYVSQTTDKQLVWGRS